MPALMGPKARFEPARFDLKFYTVSADLPGQSFYTVLLPVIISSSRVSGGV
jgi:hypothetical protein